MYNKRLKITEPDYTRLESLLTKFLNDQTPGVSQFVNAYFQKAKNESYTKTRILFDLWHYLGQYLSLDTSVNMADYRFIRPSMRSDPDSLGYLNDDTLESALNAILYDEKSPAYIGAK